MLSLIDDNKKMKMTTGLIIGLLILITSIGLYACKGKIQGKGKVTQEQEDFLGTAFQEELKFDNVKLATRSYK